MSSIYKLYGKRALDLTGAILGLLIVLPLLILICVVQYTFYGSPIFFIQRRPGLYGKPFLLYKFRTMTNVRDNQGRLLPDEERLTFLGKFLRHTSLDELPEFVNVFRGQMSLVGPRPLLMQYLDRYTPDQARRHEVKPGITGWAQINGRNAITWEEKFEHDVWYVDNISFFLDLKILFLTLWQVVHCEDIEHEGHATMPEFMGSSSSSALDIE